MAQQVRNSASRQSQQGSKTNTTRQRTARTTKNASGVRPFNMPFEKKNIIFILVGVGIVTLGYVIMGMGETMGFVALSVSPIVLLLGYLVVIPMGIMYGARKKKVEVKSDEQLASS